MFSVNLPLLWKANLPPDLRKPRHFAWGRVLLAPLQSLYDFVFGEYSWGSTEPLWDAFPAYVPGQRVTYFDRRVYECIQAVPQNASPTIQVSNASYWKIVNDLYIGVRERVKYNSQKMVFEFALNRWFVCTGIFITDNPKKNNTLMIGNSGRYSGHIVADSTFSQEYVTDTYVAPQAYDFTISVPVAVFNRLSASPAQREPIVRSFADRYTIAGMQYRVVTY